MKIVILNDTSGYHFGCELVMQTYVEQFRRVGIEVVNTFPVGTKVFDIPESVDLVVVNGEGSLHHGGHEQLVQIAERYPSVLINSVWQQNPEYTALRKFKYIAVRESLSYHQLPTGLQHVEIVPDLCFGSSLLMNYQKPTHTKDIGFTDSVTESKTNRRGFTALMPAIDFLSTMCQYRRLCIGRFHAVVAASVLQIPFSCWPSNTHKIRGLLHDMGSLEHHFDTRKLAATNVSAEWNNPSIDQYVIDARISIDQLFNTITEII